MTEVSQCRIPMEFQKVFIESNQGKEVSVPPQEKFKNKSNHEDLPKRRLSPKLFGIASMLPGSPKKKKQAAYVKENPSPRKIVKSFPTLSPQDYLDGMLRSRGYATDRYDALNTGYSKMTTPLQNASYGGYIVDIVKRGEVHTLRQILECGISPNPCNEFGESIAHMACRLGNVDILEVMLEFECDLSVADNNGRTVLHEACWSVKPCFALVEMILNVDVRLLHVADARHALSLQYAPRECWYEWLQFLESKKETFWPKRDKMQLGPQEPPKLATIKPKSLTVRDPYHSIPIKIATRLATKRLCSSEVNFLTLTNELETDSESDSDDSSYDTNDDNDNSDDDTSDAYDSEYDIDDESYNACDEQDILVIENAADITINNYTYLDDQCSEVGKYSTPSVGSYDSQFMLSDPFGDSFVLDEQEMEDILNSFNSTSLTLKTIAWSR